MSPGWQSKAWQMAFRVLKRTALIFPVLILERLTLETPTRSDNSLSDIFLSAITLVKAENNSLKKTPFIR